MTKRTIVRICSYALTFVVVLSAFAYSYYNESNYYKRQLENNYQQTLTELSEYMSNIESTLGKGIYAATDTMVSDISANLWRESSGAKSAMSKLPLSDLNLQTTYKFLSQVGEFSIALNKKISAGGKITPEEHETLVQLCEYAKGFSKSIQDMVSFYSSNESIIGNMKNFGTDAQTQPMGLKTGFTSTEDSLTDFPSLIYDGPFSDHLINQVPQFIKDDAEITRDEAQRIASSINGIPVGTLSYEGNEDSNMSCYTFADETKTIAVTKKGGKLCYVLNNTAPKEQRISVEEAIIAAQTFLNSSSYQSMTTTYYAINENICIVNFAYQQDNVTCYTDLVKVGVSMADGSIVSMDARGYISNHTARNLEKPASSAQQCQNVLSTYLEVLGCKLALIPTDAGNEVLTYEFHCRSRATGEELLVYVNTKTLKEAQILFMLYTDNGVFVK